VRPALFVVVAGCTPYAPVKLGDSGFRLELDSGTVDDSTLCNPVIPSVTTVITTAQTLEGPGPYFICPAVPVTLVDDEAWAYVSEYATATLNGDRAVAYAKNGAQVHASGDRSAIVAEPQALASVARASSGIATCDQIRWSVHWDTSCP